MGLIKSTTPESIVSFDSNKVCALELRENKIKIAMMGGVNFEITASDALAAHNFYRIICKNIDPTWED